MLLLHNCHYLCIKTRGTEVPTIDHGKLILCQISRRATFDTEYVNALEMKEDDSNNTSDKDSEGNSKEKMAKKKIQKFVAEEEQKGESEMKNPNQDGKDHENELGAKNEVATKPEARALPSKPEGNESEGMKQLATKQKNKMGEKRGSSKFKGWIYTIRPR